MSHVTIIFIYKVLTTEKHNNIDLLIKDWMKQTTFYSRLTDTRDVRCKVSKDHYLSPFFIDRSGSDFP